MTTIYVVEYILPGPRNQVLHLFEDKKVAKEYLALFDDADAEVSYRNHFRVVPVKVCTTLREALDSHDG